MSLLTYYLDYGHHIARLRRRLRAYAGTADKLLLMGSRFRFVFRPFHFENGGRRIKNQHVIVMALGNILLAQGIYKQLGNLGTHPWRRFDCDREDRNGVFSYIRRQRQLLQEETFNFCKFTRGTVFPSFKVVPSSLRF